MAPDALTDLVHRFSWLRMEGLDWGLASFVVHCLNRFGGASSVSPTCESLLIVDHSSESLAG